MAKWLTAWLLCAREVLERVAGRQTGRWTGRHPCTDTKVERHEDWGKNRERDRVGRRKRERERGEGEGEVARQTCPIGSRTGGWRRKETWGQ